jgi:hypothetical protein
MTRCQLCGCTIENAKPVTEMLAELRAAASTFLATVHGIEVGGTDEELARFNETAEALEAALREVP